MFPNNEIHLFFLFFLPPCSIDNTVCPAAINIHAHSLILHYSTCTAGYNSLPVPVHVRHFLQLQVARPPPEPSPIRNYKLCRSGWQLCVRTIPSSGGLCPLAQSVNRPHWGCAVPSTSGFSVLQSHLNRPYWGGGGAVQSSVLVDSDCPLGQFKVSGLARFLSNVFLSFPITFILMCTGITAASKYDSILLCNA